MRQIAFGRPYIKRAEKVAVMKALGNEMLVHGPLSKQFELDFANFTQAPHAVSVSSCTAALHLSYFCLGIGPGDEVLVPAQTHVATVHAVEFCGARPIFMDAEIHTGNIDLDQVEDQITSRTKAISIVHFLGMPVNMKKLMQLARKYHLTVVEDCALAIGTYFDEVHAGLHGDVGCFSFYPVKHFTTAEGGMVITKHPWLAEKIKRAKAFGLDRQVGERKVAGMYDVKSLGYNYRLNELQSALGIAQLKRVPHFLKKRKQNYEILDGKLNLDEIEKFCSTEPPYQSSYYCFSVLLKKKWIPKRFAILEYLKEKGIGTSVYYPKPVPLMSYYKKKYEGRAKDFPVATRISESSISFPVGPHLNSKDMNTIARVFKESFTKV